MTRDVKQSDSWEREEKDIPQGIDLLTTLIGAYEKNFVISDPRLPDNLIGKKKGIYFTCNLCVTKTILQGELQYFIGVQLDGSDHLEPPRSHLSERTEQQSAKLVRFTYLSH
ncbi:hypothetical protein GIB67_019114 [Kingdonia uniflora]|uniref:Uncharacterized protein n=1 Tax=Kingdonia uniflora TaxID=39325 RepID=A0A7J7MZI7_9MAGN|nr:hypothetical protein GIB67_019114 [Kingdonia uniflora]